MQNRLLVFLIVIMPFIVIIFGCGGPATGHDGQNQDGGYEPLLDTSIPAPTNLTTDADVTYDTSQPNFLGAKVILKWRNNATNQDGIIMEVKNSLSDHPDKWVPLLNQLDWDPTQTEEERHLYTVSGYTQTESYRFRAAIRNYPDWGSLDERENPIKAYSLPSEEFTVTMPKP